MARLGLSYPVAQRRSYRQFGDDFDTLSGTLWTTRSGTPAATSGAYGSAAAGWAVSEYNIALPCDDQEVTWVQGPSVGGDNTAGDGSGAFLGSDTLGVGALATLGGSNAVAINSTNGWVPGTNWVARSSTSSSWTTGTRFTFRRIGNVYTLYQAGVPLCTWTDGSNIVTRGANNRLAGVMAFSNGSTQSRSVDSWEARGLIQMGGPTR